MGWGIPPYTYMYPLPPPVSPLIYRVFTLSNRGDNAPTEIFPEKIGEIGTIFLIPIISLYIRGVKTFKWKYISKNRKKNFWNFLENILSLYKTYNMATTVRPHNFSRIVKTKNGPVVKSCIRKGHTRKTKKRA
jgi:hypothetical protein